MFYEINILVIFKFLCYLLKMNIIHSCLQYGVYGLCRNVSILLGLSMSSLLVCMYFSLKLVFLPCPCLAVLFLSLSSSFLECSTFIFVRGGYKACVINMLCMHACLFIHSQQLTNFYEIWFEFYANGGCLRRRTTSVWNIACKNRRFYPIDFKCWQCVVFMYILYWSQRENAIPTIHSLVFSLRGWVGRNQSPVMWPVWLWHTASWASSWG